MARYASPVSGLEDFARLVDGDHGLCVVSTLRPDGTIQSSVVNAGVLPHPVTGAQVVGLVSRGDAHRVANLRARPRASVVIRAGWQWAGVEGPADWFETTRDVALTAARLGEDLPALSPHMLLLARR